VTAIPSTLPCTVVCVCADIRVGIDSAELPQWLPAYRWLVSSEIRCRGSVPLSAWTAVMKSSSRVLVVAVLADGPVTWTNGCTSALIAAENRFISV